MKTMFNTTVVCSVIATMLMFRPPGVAADKTDMDAKLRERGRRAVDSGLAYLRQHQAKDGRYSTSMGVTAIVVSAFLGSHRGYSEKDGAFITGPIKLILKQVKKDGSITEGSTNRNYTTAVAMMALAATKNPAYNTAIKNAQMFLAGLQVDAGEGYAPDHAYYGGIGYGGDQRPDLVNGYMALTALRETAHDPKSEVWDKALKFISRCQNRSESNDQKWATNDGGFTYMPAESPHAGTKSYGGTTHTGLMSLLAAGVDRKDPRVQSAYDWIRANYTLDENPGTADRSGLYYYYEVFAKSMAAYGESTVKTKRGTRHWRNDYVRKMLTLQNDDGSWVNPDSPRWMEGDKNLTTARIVQGLNRALR